MAGFDLRHFIDVVEAKAAAQPAWAAQPSTMFPESVRNARRIFPDIDEKIKRFIATKLPNPVSREAKYGKHDGPMTGPLSGFYHCHLRDDAILIYRLSGRTILMVTIVSHAETEGKRGGILAKSLKSYLKDSASSKIA